MIKDLVGNQRDYFKTRETYPYKFRLQALKRLKNCILKYETEIKQSLFHDLGKTSMESYMSEIGMVLSELHMQFIILKNG